jgi:hypothetical protein
MKKTFSIVVMTTLIVIGMLTVSKESKALVVSAQSGNQYGSLNTDVGGIITTDTTWSLANSPYNLISNVQISEGITLTIEPGVIVNGNNLSVQAWGNLNAVGTGSLKIRFNDTIIIPGYTSNTSYINIGFAEIVRGDFFRPNDAHSRLNLTDSVIRDTGSFLYLWYPTADCYIERNIFYRTKGISVGIDGTRKIYIRNNAFYEQLQSFNRTFAIENWASYGTSEMVVMYNSFLSTDRIAVALPSGYDSARMIAQYNYWNTTNSSLIESMIFDRNDDLGSAGYITYTPFLTSPHPDTPSLAVLTPTPTNTATPTATPTSTATPTATPTATNTPTPTTTPLTRWLYLPIVIK